MLKLIGPDCAEADGKLTIGSLIIREEYPKPEANSAKHKLSKKM
jgi:hypothetical protein